MSLNESLCDQQGKAWGTGAGSFEASNLFDANGICAREILGKLLIDLTLVAFAKDDGGGKDVQELLWRRRITSKDLT